MIELPTMMKLPNRIIAINKNTKLNYHHAKNNYDIQTTIGIVNQNPNNPNQWGIKNLSNEIWTYIKPNGENIFIKKGTSFPLIKGSKINFGTNVGEIT